MLTANAPIVSSVALAEVKEVVEAPCIKKQYYKLGPSDQPVEQNLTKLNATVTQTLKSPKISGKTKRLLIKPKSV